MQHTKTGTQCRAACLRAASEAIFTYYIHSSNWLAANPTTCQIGTKGLDRQSELEPDNVDGATLASPPKHHLTGTRDQHVQFCHRSPVIQPEPGEQCC